MFLRVNMFKKSEFVTLGKGYDISRTSLVILDSNFCIQYSNSYAKALLSWGQDNIWIDKPFNDMWQSLNLPPLISENKIISSEPTAIKNCMKAWELTEVLVGKEKYFFLIDRDITQQEEMNTALKNSLQEVTGQNDVSGLCAKKCIDEIRNHLEGVILQMPGYVYWKDKNFKYLFCNEAASRELIGLASPKEIIGKTDYDFGWNKKLVDKYRKVDTEIFKTGKPILGLHESVIRKDGETRQLLVNKMPLRNNMGDTIGIIGISIDITAEKEAEQLRLQNIINEQKLSSQEVFKDCVNKFMHTLHTSQIELTNNNPVILSPEDKLIKLTPREADLLYLVSLHKSPKEISYTLSNKYKKSIKSSTIGVMINKQLYEKFKVHNIGQLVEKAKLLGLISFVPDNFLNKIQ